MLNRFVTEATDLVTTYEETRAGFLTIALEKNMIGDPFVKQAFAFKAMVALTNGPDDFLNMRNIRSFLLAAAGVSDKSLPYLDEEGRTLVIRELIEKWLKPAGAAYIDETVYRFLLSKGDTVGGIIRNRIGAMGQEKLVRCLLSCINVRGLNYQWLDGSDKRKKIWLPGRTDDAGVEKLIKAIAWRNKKGSRVLVFNIGNSIVNNNIDICLYDTDIVGFDKGKIVKTNPEKAIMLGELKGGIDPAGADEHWKTANTALDRIRTRYEAKGYSVLTSFVGGAIENAMAQEIYVQLCDGIMANAANLTDTNQLVEYCNWILDL
jgi:Restriction endonuclease BsobI.